MNALVEEIQHLKAEKNAVILAHYYVPEDVQAIADEVGDSFYLSKAATNSSADILVFAGVSFMGESAKILNPQKKVLLPDPHADCPMAHMAQAEQITALREQYPDLAVVCYINSTAELKRLSDVCVTSANAVKIVRSLPNTHILFIPDQNLGHYVAQQVPEKHILLNDGYCPVHHALSPRLVCAAKLLHPGAPLLAHPECTAQVLAQADYVGSTSGILRYATEHPAQEFLIGTEPGVLYKLREQNPAKQFYPLTQCCADMKLVTLEKILRSLREETHEVHISETLRQAAWKPLARMLELSQ